MGQTIGSALNVTEYIFPPVPPSYDETHEFLVRFPSGASGSGAEAEVPAMVIQPSSCDIDWKWTNIEDSPGASVGSCVIYFHPNACDIGECIGDMAVIRDGAFGGNAIVVAPEYPGYGLLGEFQPTVESVDLVAMAAWRFCRRRLGFRADQITLWGRSIGTGPAAALASKRARMLIERMGPQPVGTYPTLPRPVGGLVLVAPYTSVADIALHHTNSVVASLVSPMWEVGSLVKDPGLSRVCLIVIHPGYDEVIPLEQGKAVLDAAASEVKRGFWLDGATHNFAMEVHHLAGVRRTLAQALSEADAIDDATRREEREKRDEKARAGEASSPSRTSRGGPHSFDLEDTFTNGRKSLSAEMPNADVLQRRDVAGFSLEERPASEVLRRNSGSAVEQEVPLDG